MTSEAKVEIAKKDSQQIQWFYKLLYNLDGKKQKLVSWKLKWFFFFVFAFPLGFLLFQDPKAMPKAGSQIEAIQGLVPSITIKIPKIGSNPTDKKSSRPSSKLVGPQLILRPFMDLIPPGSITKATLISGASDGPITAQLLEPVQVDGNIVAESGSLLYGKGTSTENRLFIHFKRLVTPEGGVQLISANACDGDDRIAGLKGSKIGKSALKIGGSIGLGFIGGMAEGLQESHAQNGMEVKDPSLKNAALRGTAQAALDQSRSLMDSLKNEKPIIEVKSGTLIYVLFDVTPKEESNE